MLHNSVKPSTLDSPTRNTQTLADIESEMRNEKQKTLKNGKRGFFKQSPDPTSTSFTTFPRRMETVNLKHKPKGGDTGQTLSLAAIANTLPRRGPKVLKSLTIAEENENSNENDDEAAENEEHKNNESIAKHNTSDKTGSPRQTLRTYSDSTSNKESLTKLDQKTLSKMKDEANEKKVSEMSIHSLNSLKNTLKSKTAKKISEFQQSLTSLPSFSSQTVFPKAISDLKTKYMTALKHRGEQNKDKTSTEITTTTTEFNTLDKNLADRKADFAFKQAMLDKYAFLNNNNNTNVQNGFVKRKDSSFNPESTTLLLIGPQKSGKSTIFKELLSLAGFPPNFARAYVPTKEPIEKTVRLNSSDFELVDCGGKTEEILKWRFFLSKADVILFVVALDEYDKVDKVYNKTQLEQSLELFDSILGNFQIINSRLILILNKADRFKKKLCEKNIELSLNNKKFEGFDFEKGVNFVKGEFDEVLKKNMSCNSVAENIDIEVTTAVESENIREVLESIIEEVAVSHKTNKWKNLL